MLRANAFSKQAAPADARQRREDEAAIVEQLRRTRRGLESAPTSERFDVAALLMTDKTEQMLASNGRARQRECREHALGVVERPGSAAPRPACTGMRIAKRRGPAPARGLPGGGGERRVVRSRSRGRIQSPIVVWRKSRMVGYQGLSCDRAASSNPAKMAPGARPPCPCAPARCATEVSTATTRSSIATTAAVSEKSANSVAELQGPRGLARNPPGRPRLFEC